MVGARRIARVRNASSSDVERRRKQGKDFDGKIG